MTTKVEFIPKKSYDLIGLLDDEQDCLESFPEHSGYVCDAISELADSYIPIYTGEIWEGASDISDYIEQAIAEGLAPVDGRNIDLSKIFQSGYYVYYQESLYKNLDAMAFNYVVDKINEFLSEVDDVSELDIDEIEGEIESATDSYDNNNTFDDLDDIVNDIIDRINEEEFTNE